MVVEIGGRRWGEGKYLGGAVCGGGDGGGAGGGLGRGEEGKG